MGNRVSKVTVMITGAGAPGSVGIIKSLRLNGERNIKVIGVDANLEEAAGIGMVDKSYKIPPAESCSFIDEVLKICINEKVDVVIPLVTKELSVFSKNIKVFKINNIKVQISKYESLQIANNKYNLMKFCKDHRVPSPIFYRVRSIEEFEEKAKMLGYPEKKICFKPPESNGLRGFRIISDSQNKMDNLLNEKPNNIYIGYDEFLQMAKDSNTFPELLLMEYLPGEEYSVDALVDNGKCYAVIPRLREKIKMGISFAGTTVEDKEIIKYSRKIVEKLKLHGNIGLQFKRDSNGLPKILELNPRVQGTIVLCTASGYNMVYNSVKLALGEKPINYKIKWGTRIIRYWDEIFVYNNNVFRLGQ